MGLLCCLGNGNKSSLKCDEELVPEEAAQCDQPFDVMNGRKAYFSMCSIPYFEGYYGNLPGVIRTRIGYMSKRPKSRRKPTLGTNDCCFKEVIEIEYDDSITNYQQLASIFFEFNDAMDYYQRYVHIPTVFYTTDAEKTYSKDLKKELNNKWKLRRDRLKTKLIQASTFYEAEIDKQKGLLQKKHGILLEMLELNVGRRLARSHVATKLMSYIMGLGGLKQWMFDMENEFKDLIPTEVDSYLRNYLQDFEPDVNAIKGPAKYTRPENLEEGDICFEEMKLELGTVRKSKFKQNRKERKQSSGSYQILGSTN